MRITVLTQLAKGPRLPPETPSDVAAQLQRVKWFLWHGNIFRARQTVDDLIVDTGVESGKLARAVREFGGSLEANASPSRTTGNADSPAKPSPTSFVESAVNQVMSSANAWSRSSRCDGAPTART